MGTEANSEKIKSGSAGILEAIHQGGREADRDGQICQGDKRGNADSSHMIAGHHTIASQQAKKEHLMDSKSKRLGSQKKPRNSDPKLNHPLEENYQMMPWPRCVCLRVGKLLVNLDGPSAKKWSSLIQKKKFHSSTGP